jgi:hypothetical protein
MTISTVDAYITSLPEWQRDNLLIFRKSVHAVVPAIQEDFKWSVPVFLLDGKVIFAMSAFKAHTKYNFMANGATIQDKDGLFNNGLDSKRSRGIDLREGETINQMRLRQLIEISIAHLG